MQFTNLSIHLRVDEDEKNDDIIVILPEWSPYTKQKHLTKKMYSINYTSPNDSDCLAKNKNKTIVDEYTLYEYLENLFNMIPYDYTYDSYQISFPCMPTMLINKKKTDAIQHILSQVKLLLSDTRLWTTRSPSKLNPNAKEFIPKKQNKHTFFDEDGREYTNFRITRHL
jgi:hypothetical protein